MALGRGVRPEPGDRHQAPPGRGQREVRGGRS
jgi:hypothetical protein